LELPDLTEEPSVVTALPADAGSFSSRGGLTRAQPGPGGDVACPIEVGVQLAARVLAETGDDLAALLAEGFKRAGLTPQKGDVLALAQKIVSKAEGRDLALADIRPSQRAREIAAKLDKDPRLVEAILSETAEILRMERGLLITEPIDRSVVAEGAIVVRGLAQPRVRITRDIRFWFDQHTTSDATGRWSMAVELSPGENVLTFRVGDQMDTQRTVIVYYEPPDKEDEDAP
jgi:hypothetical protein